MKMSLLSCLAWISAVTAIAGETMSFVELPIFKVFLVDLTRNRQIHILQLFYCNDMQSLNYTGWMKLAGLGKELSRHFVGVGVSDQSRRGSLFDSPTTDGHQTMNVVFGSANGIVKFLKSVSTRGNFGGKNDWLVFLDSDFGIEDAFLGVYVPFNCFLIAAKLSARGSIRLSEVYRVSSRHSLTVTEVGSWDKIRGNQFLHGNIWERRQNLQGLVISAATCGNPPVTIVRDEGELLTVDGLTGDIWSSLEQSLNFSTTFRMSVDGKWGSLDDSVWNGMIGMIHRGEVHVAVSDFTITALRGRVVDFSHPTLDSGYRLFIANPKDASSNWSLYLRPFSMSFWWSLLGAQLLLCLFVWATYRCSRHLALEDQQGPFIFSLPNSMLYVFGAFCLQVHDNKLRSISTHIVCFTVLLAAVFIYSSYSAILISYLAVTKATLPFTSLEGLLKDGTYQAGVVSGTAEFNLFKDATDPLLRAIYSTLMKPNPDNFPSSVSEGLQKVCERRYAFIYVYAIVLGLLDEATCDVIPVSKDYFNSAIGIPMAKGFPYKKAINHGIKQLEESGVLRKMQERWFPLGRVKKKRKKIDLVTINFEQVIFVMVMLAAGMVCAAILLLCEKLCEIIHRFA